ncbi:MAG TPA: hypothetical protein VFP76_03750 [Gemmatimonadota bacterium]|nr:hypothetical protein [Gemmatimonadota bacterium]
MDVEHAATPPEKESCGQPHDQDPDRRLGGQVDLIGERPLEEDQRQPEQVQRGGVAQPPREAQPAGPAVRSPIGQDERRDGRQVIGVGGVTEPEDEGDRERQAEAVTDPRFQQRFQAQRSPGSRPAASGSTCCSAG